MTWIKQFFLGLVSGSFGVLSAAGVFTVLVAVGLVPRFAGKTHTGRKVILYEEMVIFGTALGCFASVFEQLCHVGEFALSQGIPIGVWQGIGNLFLIMYGVFAGMFVGCLALAIAEMLDSIPILSRRIGFRHGMSLAIGAMAAGKICGSLFYFLEEIYASAM